MNVLMLANYRQGVGGISGQVEMLYKHLNNSGIKTDIFSLKGSPWGRVKQCVRLLKVGRNYSVFHIHCCSEKGFLPAVIGVICGKVMRKRVVVTYHGGGAEQYFKKHHRLVRFFLSRTNANIVLSGFLKKFFDNYGIPCVVIPNIIELDESRFRLRDNIHPHYICIRSHTPIYNIECIIKAFGRVKEQLPEATLTLVGDGPLHEDLKSYVKQAGLKDVSFVGRVDNAEIYEYLDRADVMLSSPIVDNMPLSLLEGFNAGLLVISSNVGGVPYMIQDGFNGLLFESNNAEQLAQKMLYALEEQESSRSMIVAAHAGLSKYTWNKVKPMLMEVYMH